MNLMVSVFISFMFLYLSSISSNFLSIGCKIVLLLIRYFVKDLSVSLVVFQVHKHNLDKHYEKYLQRT